MRRTSGENVGYIPQIAAFADAHFSVHKEASGERTLSMLQSLSGESRIKELAVMLGGPQYTHTALNNAGELASKAATWKETRRKEKS